MNKKLKIVTIILLFAAIISTVSYCSAPYDTQTARVISVQRSINTSGYILKLETPIEVNGGIFEPGVKNGARVSKGSVIGISITGDIDGELAARLTEVTTRINEIKQSGSIADIYASDEARIFSAMRTVTEEIRQRVLEGDFISASEKASQLSLLIAKKNSIESGNASDELLVSLEEEKYRLEQQIGGMRREVTAPASGYFNTALDGLEQDLDEEKLKSITNADIDGFEKTLKEYRPSPESTGKVTDTYVWYIAASVPEEDAQKLKVGGRVTVSVDDSVFVEASVLAVNTDTTDKAAIVLKSDKNLPDVFEKRTARFEICLAKHTGLYVPSAAIRVKDDITGVYVIDENNSVTFKCVKILMEDTDYHIVQSDYTPPENCPCKPLKTYDNILVNPEVARVD